MLEGHAASAVGADTNSQTVIYRKDYTPPPFYIERTDLTFDLQGSNTLVSSELVVRRNKEQRNTTAVLELQGENLKLISLEIDGKPWPEAQYQIGQSTLLLNGVPDDFILTIQTEINPADNLALEGLYLSEGVFCTQCEAEGFRRITYYLDRPDVMSVFSTKIIADAKVYPVLLSNGNKIDEGTLDNGRYWVKWEDPYKKPCYLFALVAGDLAVLEDHFITMTGREVKLQIFAEAGDLDKCHHAMRSLKNAMRWDEETYGLEYDLDLYMIVAVDFFNMGAMENKGLNIFNTSCVLAHPGTQTDAAFQRVEAVIAHEYFHNWSGNRVTCRDWFQLSLKEGFTVFRDACFSADMNSAAVKRIEEVSLLRSAQFAEDAGPLAHPIRPDSFIEISNFYTLTIYEKGAEVIRMMRRLLGAENFRKGSDLYFQRHDGEAVTCEDFVVAMEEASGVDLQQFRNWYSQAGTPEIEVAESWEADTQVYTLLFKQHCRATAGQKKKEPFTIPVDMALLTQGAGEKMVLDTQLLVLTDKEQRCTFDNVTTKPIPAFLRGFSAPVNIHFNYEDSDLLFLLQHESDGFIRWDASRRYFLSLVNADLAGEASVSSELSSKKIKAKADVITEFLEQGLSSQQGLWNEEIDAAMLAEILLPPGYHFVVEQIDLVDVKALNQALQGLLENYACALGDVLEKTYTVLNSQLQARGSYQPIAEDIALRSLKNACLYLMLQAPTAERISLAEAQFTKASNMTDQFAALQALVSCHDDASSNVTFSALERFYQQWQNESLVVNQWLTVQAAQNRSDTLNTVKALQQHPAYDETNPNKVRALIAVFCMRSPEAFHAADNSGYALLVEETLRLDTLNPQLAARLLTPLTQWRHFAEPQRSLMQEALSRIQQSERLSKDVYEVASKSLGENG